MRSLSRNTLHEPHVQNICMRETARSYAGITALPGAITCAPGAARGRECGNG
jgi:hypothetical protein